MNGLGVVLETARRAKGLTQEELAEAVGIRQAALSRYENETRDPDEEVLARIADVLGLRSTSSGMPARCGARWRLTLICDGGRPQSPATGGGLKPS